MSGLFSALNTSSSALNVFGQALDAEQQNVSNSATVGYAAKKVRISNDANYQGAADRVSIYSSSDRYADAIVRQASADKGGADAQVQVLTALNGSLDISGKSGILAAFQQFSTAFSQLSVSPDDTTLRANAISSAGDVARSFQSLAKNLDQQRQAVDTQITDTVSQINTLTSRIASLNSGIRGGQDNDATLRESLDTLSQLVDINVTNNSDGTVTVLAGGQVPLVGDSRSYPISATNAAPTAPGGLGQASISTTSGQSTIQFSGQLGALLQLRNNVFTGLLGGNGQAGVLNDLAAGFANRVNSVLTGSQTSSDSASAPGSALFTVDTNDSTNAARSLVANALTPDQLGVSTLGANGTANGAALTLGALSTSTASSDLVSGFSPSSLFAHIASGVGQQLSTGTVDQTQSQSVLTGAQSSRQASIGVSLDREAIAITAYQRAYQASAQVISTLSTLTEVEVNLLK